MVEGQQIIEVAIGDMALLESLLLHWKIDGLEPGRLFETKR